ncbi:hypothetical protein MRB53_003770 [Persea americana]|uniref:Uncharacterized protein n=1 Tax=Persea americana TaxID=3435 RepID=A0ACC2N1M6_PERAE|nr:hypothetical protein MRB53_003770 [Persea americana]
MSNNSHGVMTPSASRKRKERDGLDGVKAATARPTKAEPVADNQLLAGYLANEFLTKGTLFGQKWDPARAADPAREPPAPSNNKKPVASGQAGKPVAYADVWDLPTFGGEEPLESIMFMVLLEEEVTGVTALRDSSLMYSCRVLLQEDEEASGRTVIVKFNLPT